MKWGGEGPWKKIHFKGRTWPKRKNDFKGEGCDLRWNFALLVFNIYVLAVVTTIISSVRKVITNDQRLTEHSRLYISNTLLSILAVPNKALFCITPTLLVCLAFPSTYQILQKHFQGPPLYYRDNFCISQFPQSSDLFFQILVLFQFFFFFFVYPYISWYSNVNNYPLLFFLVNN